MNHTFAKVPSVSHPRSSFDRSSGYKSTIRANYLFPFFVDEVLPGDTYNVNATIFGRLACPLKFPIMDNIYLDTFWFFVPHRLIWTNFQRFMGERDPNPSSSISYLFPQVEATPVTGFPALGLMDYCGVVPAKPGFSVNNYMRGYNLIWNQFFRDENLQNSVVVDLDDGPDVATDYVPLKRGKRHDYFTSCLPTPQKGTAVSIPLGTTAPIIGFGKGNTTFGAGPIAAYETGQTTTRNYAFGQNVGITGGANDTFFVEGTAATGYPKVYADLSTATAATINTLRTAVALQQFYELDMRGGTRYIEMNLAHFGVVSPDARLQRPEFLGSTSNRVNVNPVAQNSSTDVTSPQGTLAAFGTFSANKNGFVKSFTEHGTIIGLICSRADMSYQQGINRMWSRRAREDFYFPIFADIGEQAVLNKEIFYSNVPATDDAVFGYQERFAEYRYKPSLITGEFRSDYTTPLDAWHLAQDFASVPTLNSTFISESVPMSRVLAVSTDASFFLDAWIQCICARPMKVYSVPGLTRF